MCGQCEKRESENAYVVKELRLDSTMARLVLAGTWRGGVGRCAEKVWTRSGKCESESA